MERGESWMMMTIMRCGAALGLNLKAAWAYQGGADTEVITSDNNNESCSEDASPTVTALHRDTQQAAS